MYVSVYSFSPAGFFLRNPWLINFYISLLLLNGPFLFLYVKSLIQTYFKPVREIFLHLLPFSYLICTSLFSSHQKIFLKILVASMLPCKIELPLLTSFSLSLQPFQFLIIFFGRVNLLRKHRRIISNNFSSLEKEILSGYEI